MNLVAKEFVVCQQAAAGRGALVLSEFTGASNQLREAVACNPFDIEGLATRYVFALELPDTERRRDLASMAQRVHDTDVHWWVDRELAALATAPSSHPAGL